MFLAFVFHFCSLVGFCLFVEVMVWLQVVFSFHQAYVVLAFCHVDVESTLCCAHVMFAFHSFEVSAI
jgi:hypothetical protein